MPLASILDIMGMVAVLSKEVRNVKKWFVLTSVAAAAVVGVTLLAGKDDILRFLRMRKM